MMARQRASSAQEAQCKATDARGNATEGAARMERLTTAVNEIRQASADTAKIMTSIEEIAFQTNLLALNASVVMLVGSFLIGWATGPRGLDMIAAFIVDPFRGVLCLFLLDMGLVAGRGMRQGLKHLSPPVIGFGLVMPLISASLAAVAAMFVGLSPGGAALFITLAASASYIAVPAAMRLALPEARPAIYLTLSLAVTFPFNLTLGLPFYLFLAARVSGGA